MYNHAIKLDFFNMCKMFVINLALTNYQATHCMSEKSCLIFLAYYYSQYTNGQDFLDRK